MDVKIKPDLCRVCLSDQDLLPIFNDYIDYSKSNKLIACGAVNVEENDPLPAFICRLCNQVLELAYIFKTKCEETDRELRQLVAVGIERKESLSTPSSVHIEVSSCEPIFKNITITFTHHPPYVETAEVVEEATTTSSSNPYQSEPEENGYSKINQTIDEDILHVITESSQSENFESYPIEPISPTEAVKNFLNFPTHKSTKDNKSPTNKVYYNNEEIVFGEECEIVTETTTEKVQNLTPKGRYVVIKSVIKPGNINDTKKNDLKDSIRDDDVILKNEVPEPAAYIETVTENDQEMEQPTVEENNPNIQNDQTKVASKNVLLYKTFVTKAPKDVDASKRGRIKKSDKNKPPQGVSYLKSGKKPVPVSKKSKTDGKDETILARSKRIIRRARVARITGWDETHNKREEINRTLSTSLLHSDKHFKKLNNPQKQVLYQRLKLETLRPTSKKEISERGIPGLPPKHLSGEIFDGEKPRAKKIGTKRSISNDLAIINGSDNRSSHPLQSIDQDLKVINSSLNNLEKAEIKIPAKTGRHTAIKSKSPQKRNRVDVQPQDLELTTRKSERQRYPKKIFPEIDVFASQKRKNQRHDEDSENGDEDDDTNNSSVDDEKEKEGYVLKVLQKSKVELDYGSGLSCNVCHKSFPYRSHLIRHVRTHTGLKPYTCDYCHKAFSSLSSLNIHVKNHLGDFTYVCEVCQKGFVQPSVLKRHMMSHTGEHPYQCEICYRTFVHDSSLKLHLKMHTVKEPQHKCDICDKRFKYLSTLTSHIKTHSGIKPFTCSECRKSFYRRSLLKRHMRSHSDEKPYKCRYCKARFTYSGGLASHQKLHSGIRPYKCELCSFSFFRKSHLINHMNKIHNNQESHQCRECNGVFSTMTEWQAHCHQKHGTSETSTESGNWKSSSILST